MKEKEILSRASFWLVVTGSLLIGLEGLGMLADKELNPANFLVGSIAQRVRTALYLIIGLGGLHQVYFGSSNFRQKLNDMY